MSIWDQLAEPFDERLQRRTSIMVKPSDGSRQFAYPCDAGSVGFHFDEGMFSAYEEDPYLTVRLDPFFYPSLYGAFAAPSPVAWREQRYRPDCVDRALLLPNAGLEVQETFCRPADDGYLWRLRWRSRSYYGMAQRLLFIVVSAPRLEDLRRCEDGFSFRPCRWPQGRDRAGRPQRLTSGQGLDRRLAADRRRDGLAGTFRMHVALRYLDFGTYDSTEDYRADIARGVLNRRLEGKQHLVLAIGTRAESAGSRPFHVKNLAGAMRVAPGVSHACALGISFRSVAHAASLTGRRRPEATIARRWNGWFERLPRLRSATPAVRHAYYKCWWTLRLNRYAHPRFGTTIVEAPVYPPGYWVVDLPIMELISRQDPEDRGHFYRVVMDLFCRAMSPRGVFPHAMYLAERKYGARWLNDKTQIGSIPNCAWAVLAYHRLSGDTKRMKRWYPYLMRYYRFLCREHDPEGLHLWSLNHVHDSFDTTPTSERVRTGQEPHCYPPEYASERALYERSLAAMARRLGRGGEAAELEAAARATRAALTRRLWDARQGWFGVRHADGTLDSRVGMPGLYPLAYGLASRSQAEAARRHLRRLLCAHGVRTYAPGQPGYRETYWRGPVWPTSILYGAAAARMMKDGRMVRQIREGLARFVRANPSVWELLEGDSGEPASTDYGFIGGTGFGGASLCGSGALVAAFQELDGRDILPRWAATTAVRRRREGTKS